YQHDMNQKKLSEALSGVVEDCVNKVGVDLNTASAPLLEYVSGINKTIARNIVDFREENGEFESRAQLKKVPKLGPKAFEQCAGFLRIHGGKNPLDDTSVHPESYEAAKKLMEKIGITVEDIRAMQKKQRTEKKPGGSVGATGDLSGKERAQKTRSGRGEKAGGYVVRHTNTAMGAALAAALLQMQADSGREVLPESSKGTAGSKGAAGSTGFESVKGDGKGGNRSISKGETETKGGNLLHKISNREKLAKELGIGVITLEDIVSELEKPSRDPRENMPAPILRQDVLDMKDLQPGMILKGTVRNIIDFGCFVDIGVHQDGLVHISQITDRYIKHPLEAVSVGDVVSVKVLSVDPVKKRIGLTMKL
ncbi:MAG: helix-hairpin-helix domain-containing protein, partial [Lachnospiraceae bacterium]|nr:helix-hairpin-helix domain-containing protein [Lachnospiraceae bacterium]